MATKHFGTNINLDGWALTSSVTQPNGEVTKVYRGDFNLLDDALAKIKSNEAYDELNVSVETEQGTATITLTSTEDADKSLKPTGDEVRLPTVSIQGTMISPKLHQHPHFSGNEGEKKESYRKGRCHC